METELKYACPSGEILTKILTDPALLPRFTGQVERIQMQTAYYDTPSRALRARRWTLRLRQENERTVAACKTAGAQQGALTSHGEWEVNAQTIAEALPALAAAGAPEELLTLTAEGVEQTCAAAFLRRSVTLALDGGTLAELSCDLGELAGPTQREALCEVEVELKAGPLEPMLAFGEQLAAQWGLSPESRSKLARALALE